MAAERENLFEHVLPGVIIEPPAPASLFRRLSRRLSHSRRPGDASPGPRSPSPKAAQTQPAEGPGRKCSDGSDAPIRVWRDSIRRDKVLRQRLSFYSPRREAPRARPGTTRSLVLGSPRRGAPRAGVGTTDAPRRRRDLSLGRRRRALDDAATAEAELDRRRPRRGGAATARARRSSSRSNGAGARAGRIRR